MSSRGSDPGQAPAGAGSRTVITAVEVMSPKGDCTAETESAAPDEGRLPGDTPRAATQEPGRAADIKETSDRERTPDVWPGLGDLQQCEQPHAWSACFGSSRERKFRAPALKHNFSK